MMRPSGKNRIVGSPLADNAASAAVIAAVTASFGAVPAVADEDAPPDFAVHTRQGKKGTPDGRD
jgi:hypothetical protein